MHHYRVSESAAAETAPESSASGGVGASGTHAAATRAAPGVLRPVISPARRYLNPLIRSLAGSRSLRFFAVIHHRGRRSGREYATPVNARPIADGFIIPLTFGEGSDWYQNLLAANECVIRWNGADRNSLAQATGL